MCDSTALVPQSGKKVVFHHRANPLIAPAARVPSAIVAGLAWMLLAVQSSSAGDLTWGGTIGFGSDNVYRGISKTSGQPAWFADAHARTNEGWAFGVSASAERPPGQGSGAELVLYAQRDGQFASDWAWQLGLKHHESPWHDYADLMRYDEVTIGLDWRGRVQASLSYSPNTAGYYPGRYAERGDASWLELGFVQPIRGRLVAHLGLGRAQFSSTDAVDYNYASAGLRYGVGRAWFFVSWIRADIDRYYYQHWDLAGERWVASVAFSFP